MSDELGITANAVTTIRRKNVEYDIRELRRVIEQYAPAEILIGIPYRSDGSVAKRGEGILKFAETLREAFSLPIKYWDESFSTSKAEQFLIEADLGRKKRKKVIDKMAAVYILAEYLESRRAARKES